METRSLHNLAHELMSGNLSILLRDTARAPRDELLTTPRISSTTRGAGTLAVCSLSRSEMHSWGQTFVNSRIFPLEHQRTAPYHAAARTPPPPEDRTSALSCTSRAETLSWGTPFRRQNYLHHFRHHLRQVMIFGEEIFSARDEEVLGYLRAGLHALLFHFLLQPSPTTLLARRFTCARSLRVDAAVQFAEHGPVGHDTMVTTKDAAVGLNENQRTGTKRSCNHRLEPN